jgi:hypothetical protein
MVSVTISGTIFAAILASVDIPLPLSVRRDGLWVRLKGTSVADTVI